MGATHLAVGKGRADQDWTATLCCDRGDPQPHRVICGETRLLAQLHEAAQQALDLRLAGADVNDAQRRRARHHCRGVHHT